MQEIWIKFEGWLSSNWPEGLSCLNPPASDDQIAQLESKLGFKLPADYIDCLKVHNGQTGFAGVLDGMEFLSCDEVLSQWRVWKELLDCGDFNDNVSEPDEGVKNDWWNTKWIPFTHNGGGDHLCLDLDPAPTGTVGQVISMWHDMDAREWKAISFAEYFEEYVAGVLAGKYIYDEAYGGIVNSEEV